VDREAQRLKLKNFTARGKGHVLDFLKEYFGQQDEYRWVQNENETRVMIVDKNALEIEAVEHKPIIATSRGSLRWNRRTIDQLKSHHSPTGSRKYMDLMDSVITIGCYSKHGIVAEELADIVFGGFTYFRNILRNRGFHDIHAVDIGAESTVKGDAQQDIALVPVTLAFSFTESWTLAPYADVLADIKDPPVISAPS
jgi:hypothetical protein